ncbi:CVNH domain-containing protein [Sphingosinicella sp.]|uniref:CVNH domain-containing protein n=1 Tax=Sphingosinicella sp. TaxID=1917971 RepID=UPI00344D5059
MNARAADWPRGSWRETCASSVIEGNRLSANCPDSTGKMVRSAIWLSGCASFGNRNGHLYCERFDSGVVSANWQGSFRKSCRDVSIDRRGNLKSTCRISNHGWRRSELRSTDCLSRIAENREGVLTCVGRPGAFLFDGVWEGPYLMACRDISRRSHTIEATCPSLTGDWQRSRIDSSKCTIPESFIVVGRNGRLACE